MGVLSEAKINVIKEVRLVLGWALKVLSGLLNLCLKQLKVELRKLKSKINAKAEVRRWRWSSGSCC
ncbi:MAG: hypothetical protein ACKESB_00500 [Candidatus Hodgkinia cicadicola]